MLLKWGELWEREIENLDLIAVYFYRYSRFLIYKWLLIGYDGLSMIKELFE